jgi:hypothetical protein
MHRLTIDHGHSVTITDHPDRDSAHGALLHYIVGADYYLRPIQDSPTHITYELLELCDPDECDHRHDRPRSVGRATIEDLAAAGAVPADSPYNAAAAAQRWIEDHHVLWNHGADTDPGARYPLAILTAARAEARYLFSAGALLREAAHLAGVEPIGHPDQNLLEDLRHTAITQAKSTPEPRPAEIAGAVQEVIHDDTPSAVTAALIWWYALLTWGATAS